MPSTPVSMLKPLAIRSDDFPDPFHAVAQTDRSGVCINQRNRRARILATTRVLLGEQGYSGVNLRAVADISEVSVQTIYNLVGGRTALLAEAVTEHIGSQGRVAFTRAGYPNPVIALSDAYWQGAALHPDFTRHATLTYFPPDRPLFEQINRRGALLLRQAFRMMEAAGVLRPTDLGAFSSRIASMQSIVVLDCLSSRATNLLDLRRELVATSALMLMTIVTPAHAADIDQWLHTFEITAERPIG